MIVPSLSVPWDNFLRFKHMIRLAPVLHLFVSFLVSVSYRTAEERFNVALDRVVREPCLPEIRERDCEPCSCCLVGEIINPTLVTIIDEVTIIDDVFVRSSVAPHKDVSSKI